MIVIGKSSSVKSQTYHEGIQDFHIYYKSALFGLIHCFTVNNFLR